MPFPTAEKSCGESISFKNARKDEAYQEVGGWVNSEESAYRDGYYLAQMPFHKSGLFMDYILFVQPANSGTGTFDRLENDQLYYTA